MRKQRVLIVQTRKVTSYGSGGAPVIETINNKQVVGQSYEKFCKYIGSHGYMSAELIKVTDVVIDENNKTTHVDVAGEEFEKEKAKLMEILKEKEIPYGKQTATDPNVAIVSELSTQLETLQTEIDAHSDLKVTIETKDQELEDKDTLLDTAKEELETKEQLLTTTKQENEELKSKVAVIGEKDSLIEQQAKELKALKAKIANNTPAPAKALTDMLADELKDYIGDKGYLINLTQNKAELLKAIQDEESKTA